MDTLKVILDSRTPREVPTPTTSHPPQGVLWNKKSRNTNHLWESGCAHSINLYFKLYTEYKPLEKEDNTEVNTIRVIINTKGKGTFVMDLE